MSNKTIDEENTLEYYRTRLWSPIGTTEILTPKPPARKLFCQADAARLKINPLHPPELAATIQICKNLGKLLDPAKAALFQYLPPELRLQIWEDKFATWVKTQPRVRIVAPAGPVVSGKVICNKLDDLPNPYPNFLSTGAGNATEICPLLSTSFEARDFALEQFAGSLDVCSCVRRQCSQCRDMGFYIGIEGSHDGDCKKFCQENCRGKTYFTPDQIFYIPSFSTISNWIENFHDLEKAYAKDFYKTDDGDNLLAWASKLQNVALEAYQLAGQSGEWLKIVLSEFKSLKKLYLVWRYDLKDGVEQSHVAKYTSEDTENKISSTLEQRLRFLKHSFFKSPELWLNELPGVNIEFIYVPVKFNDAQGGPLSSVIVNRCVRTLEEYFTPGNHARKIAEENRQLIQANLADAISLLQRRQQDRRAFLKAKRRGLTMGEEKAEEFEANNRGMPKTNIKEDYNEDFDNEDPDYDDSDYEYSEFKKWERDHIVSIKEMVRYLRDWTSQTECE